MPLAFFANLGCWEIAVILMAAAVLLGLPVIFMALVLGRQRRRRQRDDEKRNKES